MNEHPACWWGNRWTHRSAQGGGCALVPGCASSARPWAAFAGLARQAQNRVGSFVGPMAASFQVNPPAAPPKGDIETAEAYGRRVAEITS